MKKLYLGILMTTSLLLGGHVFFAQSILEQNTSIYQSNLNDCNVSNVCVGCSDGVSARASQNEIAANDIIVPMGSDMTLNAVMANFALGDQYDVITSAKIWIFADNNGAPAGSPGDEITSQTLAPTSQTLINRDFGMDFIEVLWDLSPIFLQGSLNVDTRYWIGLSVTTVGEYTSVFWEVTDETMIGQPAYYSWGSTFEIHGPSKDGGYTFFADCEPTTDDGTVIPLGCGAQITSDVNSDGEGQNCTIGMDKVVANDIIVPINSDMFLTGLMPSLVFETGQTAAYASVTVYEDNNGLPGGIVNQQYSSPVSQTFKGTANGKDMYDVLFQLNNPVFMAGKPNVETVYWIAISVESVSGSPVFMEVAYDSIIGNAIAIKSGGNFSIPNPNHEGVYAFYANCNIIDGLTGPEDGICGNSELEVIQDVDQFCFGSTYYGGMLQSFTAEQVESSGVGIKFTDQSRGLEVTLSLWDALPTQNGNMLATRTTETYGGRWVDVFWESFVELTVGAEYFILIEGDDALSCLRGGNDVYPGGQAYSEYQPFPSYDYTFRTFYCYDVECSQEIGGWGFPNSFITSKDQSSLVATDITVPMDSDFTLDQIQLYFWVLPGASIENADIVFYENNSGVPGSVINTLNNVVPSSQSLSMTKHGYDILTVNFDISPQVLHGKIGNISTYWVSFHVAASAGSGYINATTSEHYGYASLSSPDTGLTWVKNEGWDNSYIFAGICEPIVVNPCDNPEIEINQTTGNICMASVSSGVAQSFTSDSYESAGAAIKFNAISNGFDVTLSIWDNLPNAGGNVLISKTTQTSGENWVEVFWDQVLPITPGEVYYLVVQGPYGLPCVSGNINNIYEGGQAYAGQTYDSYPDWDFVFKTYSCDGGGPTGNCSEENLNDGPFETGANSSVNSPYLVANDITLATGVDFSLTKITTSLISDSALLNVDVFYYADNSGLPGEEIGSQISAPITHQTIIGELSGMDVIEIAVSVDSFLFEGQYDSETTYWIGMELTSISNSSNVFWLSTTENMMGNKLAQRSGNGTWGYTSQEEDGVYKWEGICSEIDDPLGVGDHDKIGFYFYPNPSNDVITVKSDDTIESVSIYNLLGQLVIEHPINGTSSSIKVNELSSGTYLMKVSLNGLIQTFKMIKI